MADTSLTPTETANNDADPAGDLVLVVGSGDNQTSIRASSKVLSLASPVLAAMFSPRRFMEGIALSSSTPPDIHLPDDDPETVTMFCHLVHFREYHGKQPYPSFNQLVNMAVFCDKYDAGLALNPWSELWLHRQSGLETPKKYGNLVALAYTFDNQEAFWTSSRCMMLYDLADRSPGTRDELLPLLPQGFYGKSDIDPQISYIQTYFSTNCPLLREASIDEDRKAALLDLSSMIDQIIARFLQENARYATHDTHLKVGFVIGELYRLNVWPISTRVNTLNLDCIQNLIAKFDEQDSPIKTQFKRELTTVIARAVDALEGLCLCCVRKGKTSLHQGNCHARLRYLCTG